MLFECWPAVSDVGPALKQHWVNASCMLGSAPVINSRPNTETLTKCWASVVDDVPALKQRCLHVIVQRYACMVSQSQRHTQQHSADTSRLWINVGSTLVHHLRRWTNVKPTLIQFLVSAGLPIHMYRAYIICLSATHCPTKQTFPDVALMLGELHRRCSNIKLTKKKQFICSKNLGLGPTGAHSLNTFWKL